MPIQNYPNKNLKWNTKKDGTFIYIEGYIYIDCAFIYIKMKAFMECYKQWKNIHVLKMKVRENYKKQKAERNKILSSLSVSLLLIILSR